LANPPFPNVDAFISRENLANRIRSKLSPAAWLKQFTVMMVNDEARPVRGRLTLSLETRSGIPLARSEEDFAMDELGAKTYRLSLAIPNRVGDCILKAVARPEGKDAEGTVCRRWTSVAE